MKIFLEVKKDGKTIDMKVLDHTDVVQEFRELLEGIDINGILTETGSIFINYKGNDKKAEFSHFVK